MIKENLLYDFFIKTIIRLKILKILIIKLDVDNLNFKF
jgi:hypothetical protein